MSFQNLERAIRESSHIVCLLGMSIAADCGCFNYRDLDNAYSVESRYGYSPEEIFSANFFGTRTKTFYEYYHREILNHLGEPLEPLPTLKRLENEGKVFSVITRSIYGLPARAGIRNHVDMHGTVYDYKCTHCGRKYDIRYVMDHQTVPFCETCGAPVRPEIVLGGEMIPNEFITASAGEVERADTLLVLGCTLRSTLARNAVKYFEGSKIILINEEENYSDAIADLVFHGRPRDVLPMICR